MSRVGKQPIAIPTGVTFTITGRDVAIKGARGEMKYRLPPEVKVEVKDGKARVTPINKAQRSRAMWGTSQRQLHNLVEGVSKGFSKHMEIQGVGFRAAADKNFLTLALGFSHEIKYAIPAGIEIKCAKPTEIAITGADRKLVGQVAAEIRELRKPEPYKGKGVNYKGGYIRRKEGKKK